MKKFYLTTVIAVFLLIFSNEIQAQTTPNQLNQTELIKQFLGSWQTSFGKDTVEIWETQQYGNALVMNVSTIIKGQKNPNYINNMGFDPDENKFKGYLLFPYGSYSTWIGYFTSEKIFTASLIHDLNPLVAQLKFQGAFGTNEFIWTVFNAAGVKTGENKYKRVK
jgi:hypothetical protein